MGGVKKGPTISNAKNYGDHGLYGFSFFFSTRLIIGQDEHTGGNMDLISCVEEYFGAFRESTRITY